jgi:hypothetical protein
VLILLIGMSFDEDFDEWYKKNYPHEWNLKEEIETRTEQILRSMPATMPSNEIRKFELGVVLNPATNKLGIAINLTGELFLGALGKAILDSLTAHFEGLLSSGIGNQLVQKKVKVLTEHTMSVGITKTCSNCGSENQVSAKFCDQCANKF